MVKTGGRMGTLKRALLLILAIFGCSSALDVPLVENPPGGTLDTSPEPVPGESLSNTEARKVLLVVSFGTSYNKTRDAAIGAIEAALQAAYPQYGVRRAFTSQTIIDILKKREGLEIDNVEKAMERLVADGVQEVVIQPTHIMNGYEYDDLAAQSLAYADRFSRFKLSRPLLIADVDYDRVIEAIRQETASYADGDTAIVYMGHGTAHDANATYQRLQDSLMDLGYGNYFIGAVEGEPGLDGVMPLVEASGASRVILLPLMVVAGDHAANDMAGDGGESWKSQFEAKGFQVECVLKGLGEYKAIRDIYVAHAADAMAE